MKNTEKKLFIIIDANSVFHRAYHALPRFQNKKGELTNAVYGFSLVLIKTLKDFKPDYIAAAFDVPGKTFREEEFEDYKAHREKAPDELYEQIPKIKKVLKTFNIPIYEKEGYEADDVIGTAAQIVEDNHKHINTVIVSGDLDTLQLVTENTRVYTMKKSVQDTVVYDKKAVKKRFDLEPKQLADFKGLMGDASDNIPGVSGVGEKTASQLLKKYKTLEELYDALESGEAKDISERVKNLLLENKEQALFSRMLATIKKDVSINFNLKDTEWGGFEESEVVEVFREFSFQRLVEELEDLKGFEHKTIPSGRKAELLRDIEDAREAGLLSEKIYRLEKKLVPAILEMEEYGIKVDKNVLGDVEKEAQKELNEVEKEIYKLAGEEFNINSPQQLSKVVFEKLEIDTKGLKKTAGGKVSTAADELEKIKGRHEIVDLILKQRELQKLLTTYIKPLSETADKDGRIHTKFRPLGTATGRISSAEPNMQNIPVRGDWGEKIRSAFVAEEGNMLLACDYSQMELRIAAHMAEDENMIDAFREEKDIHKITASLVFDVDEEKVTPEMRHRAKALNFGIIYGIGPKAFSESAEISYNEAEEFIQRYFNVFKGIDNLMQELKEKAHKLGYAETIFGRKRFLPEINSPNPRLRANAERVAINMPVQGTSADIVKMAMVETHKSLSGVNLLLQIHDELLWEGEEEKIQENAEKAKNIMENITELSVPLKVDYSIGNSWGKLNK